MSDLTPREIVAELDKYIIGQNQAKRMVAVAVRNRWRRQRLAAELRNEVAPRNIIMMGPTGVGKTEIARRLAKLCSAPFIKVEATKYTEVGYVGRDVESMIRDLMEIGINLVRAEEAEKVKGRAEAAAEERLLDLLLPSGDGRENTREKLRELFRQGFLDDREVEFEVKEQSQPIGMLGVPGMEQLGDQMKGAFSKLFPQKTHRKKMKVGAAWRHLIEDESSKLVDEDKITDLARERVEQMGIVFIDEIDKLASGSQQRSADISREGVQRDLLPIVEGSAVNTKYGLVNTDHILFIAAGAFHLSKPSDLFPELQGRFPLRAELEPLGKEEFYRILTEPHNSLTRQYEAMLETEGVRIEFTDDGLREIAAFAEDVNSRTENIGARRLHTIMEKILADRELYGNGGVILSGGDPLMQPEAATAVLKKCKEHGIRTAIETTAFAKPLAFSRFIANADMIIIDLKHYSEKKYVQFTGVSNHSILENLDFAVSIGKKVAVRITITPGINDTLIDARRYAHLLSEHHIRHVILLSYSNLGIIKYEKYTQSPALARDQTFSGQDMENYANMLRGLGFDVQIEQ